MPASYPPEILRCKRLVLGAIWSIGTLPPLWMFKDAGVEVPPWIEQGEPEPAPPPARDARGPARPQRRKPGPVF
jgi:hypothetical protein